MCRMCQASQWQVSKSGSMLEQRLFASLMSALPRVGGESTAFGTYTSPSGCLISQTGSGFQPVATLSLMNWPISRPLAIMFAQYLIPVGTSCLLQSSYGCTDASCCHRGAADLATLSGAHLMQIPLDMLRAERVEQLKKYEHVLVTTSESGTRLEADRKCWQACVRLRRVYGLQQAAILERG